jgi:very-short-patch-repair endonuclease
MASISLKRRSSLDSRISVRLYGGFSRCGDRHALLDGEPTLPLGKIFKVLIARGEAVQRANLATQQALMGLTPETDWQTVSTANPNWRDLFAALCDSPPEIALLDALIEAYGLTPHDGVLKSLALKLQLQVPMKPYRVDFLINDKIIVEVDGKTYHSSRDAVKRDLGRDEYFRSKGFAVIRIPAQDIFADVQGAVTKITRSSELRPQRTSESAVKPKRFTLSDALSGIGKAISDVNSFVEKAQVNAQIGQGALAEQREAFYRETKAIDRAISVALKQRDGDRYRAQSADHAAWYDAAHDRQGPSYPAKPIPEFRAPAATNDPEKDAALRRAFTLLVQERSKYFLGIREQMRADAALSAAVSDKLCREGRTTLWNAITPATD